MLRRLGSAEEQRLVVLLKDLATVATPAGATRRVRLESLDHHHLPGLSELNRRRCHTRADHRFEQSLADGHRGFVGFSDGRLVGYYWWVDHEAPNAHPDLTRFGLGIELEPGDVYGSDFYVPEEHRRGGTANAFLFALETELADRGYRRLWGYVQDRNRAARWLYSTRGYEPMWTVSSRVGSLGRRTPTAPADAHVER